MHDKEDIFYAVRACVAMHNMMVATRVHEWGLMEDECWYESVNTSTDATPPRVDEAERAVDDEDKYLQENAELADVNNDVIDLDFKEKLERIEFMPRKLRIVQRRWTQLYDVKAHVRLQDAVKKELYTRRNDDNDGLDLVDLDPITDL